MVEIKGGSWKVMENDVYLKFREENGRNVPKMKGDFQENAQI